MSDFLDRNAEDLYENNLTIAQERIRYCKENRIKEFKMEFRKETVMWLIDNDYKILSVNCGGLIWFGGKILPVLIEHDDTRLSAKYSDSEKTDLKSKWSQSFDSPMYVFA